SLSCRKKLSDSFRFTGLEEALHSASVFDHPGHRAIPFRRGFRGLVGAIQRVAPAAVGIQKGLPTNQLTLRTGAVNRILGQQIRENDLRIALRYSRARKASHAID